jgi:hypothetical protein
VEAWGSGPQAFGAAGRDDYGVAPAAEFALAIEGLRFYGERAAFFYYEVEDALGFFAPGDEEGAVIAGSAAVAAEARPDVRIGFLFVAGFDEFPNGDTGF